MGGGVPGASGPMTTTPSTAPPATTTGGGFQLAGPTAAGSAGGAPNQTATPQMPRWMDRMWRGQMGGNLGFPSGGAGYDSTNTTTAADMGYPMTGGQPASGSWNSGYQGIGNIDLTKGDWNWGLFDSRPQYWDQWRPNQVVPGGYAATKGEQPYPTVPGVGVGGIWPTHATAVDREGAFGNYHPGVYDLYGGPTQGSPGATDWLAGRHSNVNDQAFIPYGQQMPYPAGFQGMGGMTGASMSGMGYGGYGSYGSSNMGFPSSFTASAGSGYGGPSAGMASSMSAPSVPVTGMATGAATPLAQGTPAPTITPPTAPTPQPPADWARLQQQFAGPLWDGTRQVTPGSFEDQMRWAGTAGGGGMTPQLASDYTRYLQYNGGKPGGSALVDQWLAGMSGANAQQQLAAFNQRQAYL